MQYLQVFQLASHPGVADGSLTVVSDWINTPYFGRLLVYYAVDNRVQWGPGRWGMLGDASLRQHTLPPMRSLAQEYDLWMSLVRSIMYLGAGARRG